MYSNHNKTYQNSFGSVHEGIKKFIDDNNCHRILACIDWGNVSFWRKTDKASKYERKVDHKKLYYYLHSSLSINDIKLFFGTYTVPLKSKEYLKRWAESKTKKNINSDEDLYRTIKELLKYFKVSSESLTQIRNFYLDYESHKRISDFKKIGYDLSSNKPVKTFLNSIADNEKHRKIIKDIIQNLKGIEVITNKYDSDNNISEKIDEIISSIKSINFIDSDYFAHIQDIIACNITILENISFENNISKKDVTIIRQKIESIYSLLNRKSNNHKCDFDVEITLEMIKNVENYDMFVLFSGDGDFAPTIKYLSEKQKYVLVVSSKNKLGVEINNLKIDKYLFIQYAEKVNFIWV